MFSIYNLVVTIDHSSIMAIDLDSRENTENGVMLLLEFATVHTRQRRFSWEGCILMVMDMGRWLLLMLNPLVGHMKTSHSHVSLPLAVIVSPR